MVPACCLPKRVQDRCTLFPIWWTNLYPKIWILDLHRGPSQSNTNGRSSERTGFLAQWRMDDNGCTLRKEFGEISMLRRQIRRRDLFIFIAQTASVSRRVLVTSVWINFIQYDSCFLFTAIDEWKDVTMYFGHALDGVVHAINYATDSIKRPQPSLHRSVLIVFSGCGRH